MDELLARQTKLTIQKIESGMQLEPDTIYLISPKHKLKEFSDDVYKITELIHSEDYEMTMHHMSDHLEGKTPAWDVEYRIKLRV